MKRDLDLIRALLLFAEAKGSLAIVPENLGLDPPPARVSLLNHVRLLVDAEFVESQGVSMAHPDLIISRITWAGYEYMDAIRSDTIWRSMKETAKEKGIGLTVDLALAYFKAKATALLLGPGPA